MLVTGGDSGIGCAVGVHFSAEGATVAFTHVPGIEEKTQSNFSKSTKTPAAHDPLKIATDFGFDHNCKKVTKRKLTALNNLLLLFQILTNSFQKHFFGT